MRFKILVFVLAAVLLGGTLLWAYWFYDTIDQPERQAQRQLQKREKEARAGALPDPAKPTYTRALEALREGRIDEACALLQRLMQVYQESPHAEEARHIIGEINMDRLFSRAPSPGKRDYVVKRGDSMARIEKGSLTTIPFLTRLNQLNSISLQPGDRLVYQPLEFEITIDLKSQKLILRQKESESLPASFFKEYALTSAALPPQLSKKLKIKTHIQKKNASIGGKAVLATDPRLSFARKSLQTTTKPGSPSVLLRPESERIQATASPSKEDATRPLYGLFLEDGDLDELYTIIRPGTPVEVNS